MNLFHKLELPRGEEIEVSAFLFASPVVIAFVRWWPARMPEDVFFVLGGKVVGLEVGLTGCQQEGYGYCSLAGVAWSGVVCVFGVLRIFVGLGVLSQSILEDLVADLWREASVV